MSRVVDKIWLNLDEDLHRDDALLSSPFADFARYQTLPVLTSCMLPFSLSIWSAAPPMLCVVVCVHIASEFVLKAAKHAGQKLLHYGSAQETSLCAFLSVLVWKFLV